MALTMISHVIIPTLFMAPHMPFSTGRVEGGIVLGGSGNGESDVG